MDKQTIDERLDGILRYHDYYGEIYYTKAAIRQLVLESLPGEIKPEFTWYKEGFNACLSSIRKSWEPIKE